MLDRAGFNALDYLVSNAEDGVVAKAGENLFARSVFETVAFLSFGDHFREVPAFNMFDSRPLDQAPGEESVGITLCRLLNAVGVEDDRTREFGELFVLVLPRAAKVGDQMRVFLQTWITVRRQHLAMGIDIDSSAFGLFE